MEHGAEMPWRAALNGRLGARGAGLVHSLVDAPLPDLLDKGIVWIEYRTEHVGVVPVFGKEGLNVSPRAGHLHIHVDDLVWLRADASDLNTIDIAGMPPGEHKVLIELADANHQVFRGQAETVKFTVPKTASPSR